MADLPDRERFSLKRWSQRKLAAARETPLSPAGAQPPVARTSNDVAPTAPASGQGTLASDPPAVLPPLESLTFDTDFTAFMQPDVDPSLRRAALKKLFSDPRFNVMDGLDVYIDDYSKPDPIDAETVRGLVQARYIFDPPQTRVNALGDVEDVPDESGEAVPESAEQPETQDPPSIAATEDAPLPIADDVARVPVARPDADRSSDESSR